MYVMCVCIFGASFLHVWRGRWLWDPIRGKYKGSSIYPIGEFLRLYCRTSRQDSRCMPACVVPSCVSCASQQSGIHLSIYPSLRTATYPHPLACR